MDLALNNLQRLICHKTQETNQPINQPTNQLLCLLQAVADIGLHMNANKTEFMWFKEEAALRMANLKNW